MNWLRKVSPRVIIGRGKRKTKKGGLVWLLVWGVVMGGGQATEITPIDFTGKSDNPPPHGSTSEVVKEETEIRPIRLQLRELHWLREAAHLAGGDIEVSIRPINITSEDLIMPLAKSGYFEVTSDAKNSFILVSSRTEDPYLEKLRQEVSQLEKRRRILLGDLSILDLLQRPPNAGFPSEGVLEGEAANSLPSTAPTVNPLSDKTAPIRVVTLSPRVTP